MNSLKIHMMARIGNEVGAGHWGRSLELARVLQSRNHQVYLEPINDGSMESYLLPPIFGEKFDHIPDIQWIDDRLNREELITEARFHVSLDLFTLPDHSFDLLVNALEMTPKNLLEIAKTRRLVGLEYLLLPPESALATEKTEKKLLFVLGGKDINRMSLHVLESILSMSTLPFEELTVVLRPDHPDWKKIESLLQDTRFRGKILPTQPTLFPLLKWCSVVLSNGGLTSAFSILQNRAGVFLPQTEHECELLRELKFYEKQIIWPSDQRDVIRIQEALKVAFFEPVTSKVKIDTLGAARIADELEELAK